MIIVQRGVVKTAIGLIPSKDYVRGQGCVPQGKALQGVRQGLTHLPIVGYL